MEKYERELVKEIMAEMLRPIIESMVKMAVDYTVAEAYKQDKGRNQPFWTKKWRGK